MEISIGNRVYLKKTGQLANATVVGIIDSARYNRLVLFKNEEVWGKLYPNWMDKPIVFVEFDKPQRNCTFEEFCTNYKDNPDFQSLCESDKEYYYLRIPPVYFVSAPIDDVEVLN